jgi:hypothetical protein
MSPCGRDVGKVASVQRRCRMRDVRARARNGSAAGPGGPGQAPAGGAARSSWESGGVGAGEASWARIESPRVAVEAQEWQGTGGSYGGYVPSPVRYPWLTVGEPAAPARAATGPAFMPDANPRSSGPERGGDPDTAEQRNVGLRRQRGRQPIPRGGVSPSWGSQGTSGGRPEWGILHRATPVCRWQDRGPERVGGPVGLRTAATRFSRTQGGH